MNAFTPHSDRELDGSLEEPPRTVGEELQREAQTIGSAMQLFLRLRWWIATVVGMALLAWKGTIAAAPVQHPQLESRVDAIARDVGALVKLECLRWGSTSVEVTLAGLSCAGLPATPDTAAARDHTMVRVRR